MFELAFLSQVDFPLILAQAAPAVPISVDPISGFYGILLRNGMMGAAIAVLAWLLIRRDGDLQKSQEGRLADAKFLADVVKDHTVALVASNAAADERNRALEIASRAAEKSAIIIEQMTKEISELHAEIKGLKK